jgi:hypothetical protein
MNIARALDIVRNIDSDTYSEKQKAAAIFRLIKPLSRDYITKDDAIKAAEWLWHRKYAAVEVDNDR